MRLNKKDKISVVVSAESLDHIYGLFEELRSEMADPEAWADLDMLIYFVLDKVIDILEGCEVSWTL